MGGHVPVTTRPHMGGGTCARRVRRCDTDDSGLYDSDYGLYDSDYGSYDSDYGSDIIMTRDITTRIMTRIAHPVP